MQELVGIGDVPCRSCESSNIAFIRHLLRADRQCVRCAHRFQTESAEFERHQCPRCCSTEQRIDKDEIVPPFPGEFEQALVDHRWGVSGTEDAELVLSEIQAVSLSSELHQILLLTRFCRRLRLYGSYASEHDRDILRNIEGNIFRDYFRMSGDLPAGVEALKLFEEGAAASDPLGRALDEHNVAMAVYSMLARYSEREVILQTGRPDIRAAAIAAAERALKVFAGKQDEGSRIQAARILHIIGDLLRAGDSTEAERKLSVEHLEKALKVPGIPAALHKNIKESQKATRASLSGAERGGVLGKLKGFFKRSAPGRTAPASSPGMDRTSPELSDEQFRAPDDLKVEIISLDAEPEQIAEDLIRDSLPKTFLDQIDISDEQGISRLMACLLLRQHQASLEKDEIIRFVERNRRALGAGGLDLLRLLIEAGKKVEGGEGLAKFFEYFSEQVAAALAGRPQDIDVKSDRLLWLLYALAQRISSGSFQYEAAIKILAKPEHSDRISPLSLKFLLYDYADSVGRSSEVSTEYVMLIDECALMTQNVPAAAAATALLAKLPPPTDVPPFVDLMQRAKAFLTANGRDVEDTDAALARLRSRFEESVADDDF
jgi:hypothetical protein